MTQWVYGFGGGSADGDASMKNLLGGKGANLAEMCRLGITVPSGSTRASDPFLTLPSTIAISLMSVGLAKVARSAVR